MAESISNLQFLFKVAGTLAQSSDLSTLSDQLALDYSKTFGNGTGANQANMWWHDQRTLTASATEDLDMAASLTSAFGTSITFTSVKALLVVAAAGNTNNVNVTRPASAGVPLFLAAGDGTPVHPGGVLFMVWPGATGIAVTATTADLITFTNSAGSTSVTYDVFILGEV